MARPLGERTWEEVAAHPGRLLAVPMGATEQHGPHLPLDTDTRVALALARSLADRRGDVLVAPALAYGSSGEHAGFAGTVSIGQAAVELVILELARGLGAEFRGLVLVSPMAATPSRWPEPPRRPGKAARARLAVGGRARRFGRPRPSSAKRSACRVGRDLDHAPPAPWAGPPGPRRPRRPGPRRRPDRPSASRGVRAVSTNGVLGDPAGASATDGEALLRRLGDDLARAVQRSFPP